MVAQRINPLTWHTPIVDKKGNPTREFQIKWEQLNRAANSIPSLSTPAAVSAVLDVLSGGNVNGSILVRSGGTWQGYPSPSNGAKFLAGNNPPTWSDVDDADLVLSDVLTNNVSTSKHGFAPKLPNDATKYLDGTGAYSVPAGGGGGGPLASGTVSSAATLDIVLASYTTYTGFKLYLTNFIPATDAQNLWMRISDDSGATFKSAGTDYSYAVGQKYPTISDTGIDGYSSSSTAAQIILANSVGNGSVEGANIELTLSDPLNSAIKQRFHHIGSEYFANDTYPVTIWGGGAYRTAAAVNAIRIMFASGNIASGKWSLHGF